MGKRYTFVTLLSTDSYFHGVMMLRWSLKKVGSQYPLIVMCSDRVSQEVCECLEQKNITVFRLADHIVINDVVNQGKRNSNWTFSFDKLYTWTLSQYDKVVFIDSDMQVIRNIDYLFDYPHMSAVRADEFNEPGLDKLNSGLMVIEPNKKEFDGLCEVLESGRVQLEHMGDQDIIRAYYEDWGSHKELTLPSGLNVLYSEVSHGVIHKKDVEPVSVIHYIGERKPWMMSPRAIWRRSKGNFLGKHLLRYGIALFWQFPRLLLKRLR